MQPRRARALQAELHGSSGANKRRHQDDNLFTTSCLASLKTFAPFNEHEIF